MNYLETERLILRPFAEQDTESLFIILSDVEVNAFLPMFPLKDIEEAKTYLHEKHTAINSGKTLFYYAICLKGNNIPIGYIHVSGGKYVTTHLHLNVTYLMEADPVQEIRCKPDENSAVGWIPVEQIAEKSTEPWFVERVYGKLCEKVKRDFCEV